MKKFEVGENISINGVITKRAKVGVEDFYYVRTESGAFFSIHVSDAKPCEAVSNDYQMITLDGNRYKITKVN